MSAHVDLYLQLQSNPSSHSIVLYTLGVSSMPSFLVPKYASLMQVIGPVMGIYESLDENHLRWET